MCWGMKIGWERRGCLSHPTVWPAISLLPPFSSLRDPSRDEGSKGTKKHQLVSLKLLAFVPFFWSLGSLAPLPHSVTKKDPGLNTVLVSGNPGPRKDQAFSSKCSCTSLGIQRGLKNQGAYISGCLEQSQCMICILSFSKVCEINRMVPDNDSWDY